MNPGTDPLAALKPIHLPTEPSWWPPAPAWWLLACSILLAITAAVLLWRHRRRAAAPRKAATQELARIEALVEPRAQLQALNQLLRRAARLRHGPHIAALPPQAWAEFLADNAPAELKNVAWLELAEAAYRPDPPRSAAEYLAWGRAWLSRL